MTHVYLQEDAWTDIEEGTEALLDEWLVKAGDSVKAGQTIGTVIVAKSSFDLQASADGTITKLLIEAQGNFPRGQAAAEIQAT